MQILGFEAGRAIPRYNRTMKTLDVHYAKVGKYIMHAIKKSDFVVIRKYP